MNESTDLIHGKIWKAILWFSIPMLVGNLFQQLYNTVDGSLTVVSIFSLTKSLKTLIISMLLSFFIVKFVKFNVGICRIV